MVKRLCSFNVVDFISAVEERPCLWDRRRVDFKDRLVKSEAWKEIGRILYENYECMDEQEQKSLETSLLDRWRNIRDAFIKSLKRKSSEENSNRKKYMYHDYLLFLLHNCEKEETSSPFCDESMEATELYTEEEDIEIDDKKQITVEIPANKSQSKSRKRKAISDDENGIESNASESCSSSFKVIDEDEAFLWSLLPTMKTLNRDDNFQFRIEIMQILQKYKMHSKMQELQSSLNNTINS